MQPVTKEAQYERHHKPQIPVGGVSVRSRKKKLPENPQKAFEPIMARRVVSVNSRIVIIMKMLYKQRRAPFLSLFEQSSDRADIVATFLAVLELVKNKRVMIEDDGKTVSLL